ncbi:hypothetical protein Tco_1134253 [Tanacetum coccineum]
MVDEQQDDQQQQQNMLDALLVPTDEQVKIGLSNFRIGLEKQYSFFNAFIRTANAPENGSGTRFIMT